MRHYNLLAIAILFGIIACSGEKKDNNIEEKTVETVLPNDANEVTVMTLKSSDFNHELVSNGKLSARCQVDLRFETTERVAVLHVKNGDRVVKGQKLAELSTFRLQNKTAAARDALERAKLELQDVLIGQGYALTDSADIPPETMQLIRVKSGYDQALIQYQLAEYEERNAVLTAPFDGVVANLFAKQYNTTSSSDVFCTIIDPNSLEAEFTVLENELPLIKNGDRVEITPFALNGFKAKGYISEINPLVDENGMVQVKAAVTDSGRLFEGMNVRISIHRSLSKQLIVPKEAVVLRSGKQVVFVLDSTKTKACWTYVHTGLENANNYTIVDGLKENDIVITSGNINLAHETPVTIIKN